MAPFFPPLNLPEAVILLITDELAAPADFVLHRTLTTHLKKPIQRVEGQQNKTRAVILSVSEGLGRWKALASKLNINLQSHIDGGSLAFIDVLAEVQPADQETGLKKIYDKVSELLLPSDSTSSPKVLILDDVSTLEWIGFSPLAVSRLVRALRSLCLKTHTTFLIRHHVLSASEAEPDDLFRLLLQICNYHLEVRPLSSGRSGAVSGEICLHRGVCDTPDDVKLVPRNSALQYRLTDSGPEFFAKGTSEGVL